MHRQQRIIACSFERHGDRRACFAMLDGIADQIADQIADHLLQAGAVKAASQAGRDLQDDLPIRMIGAGFLDHAPTGVGKIASAQ